MNRRTRNATVAFAVALGTLAAAPTALSDQPPQIKIGVLSQTEGRTRASATATISARTKRSPEARPQQPSTWRPTTRQPVKQTTSDSQVAPPYPTLAADSKLAKNPTPFGPGTFWYQGGAGTSCIYAAGTSPLCYRITGTPGSAAQGINPATVAASIASRLELAAGAIEASPSGDGLTGSPSWFWLNPRPTAHETTVSVAGETITVDATPTIDWVFGDGATLTNAGPGKPYAPGPIPPDAVTRTYQTRCLPGDQGRDPAVLPICGNHGYHVAATVTWRFAYRATGPIDATGTVPARTTATDRSYPVSEARAFLDGASR